MELELRHFEVEHFDIRGHGDERTVRGLAVPFDKKSVDLGGFREVIRQGAATESLKSGDIAMLWQHDHAQPISRMSATRNALVLEERKGGVFFEQAADSLTEFQLDKINDGVVRHMSFGFRVANEEGSEVWTEGGKIALREILKMDLREISPVTLPAYQSTKLAVRSAQAAGIILPDTVRQEITFNVNALDGESVAKLLREQGGTISQIIADAARESFKSGVEVDAAVLREHDERKLDLAVARMRRSL